MASWGDLSHLALPVAITVTAVILLREDEVPLLRAGAALIESLVLAVLLLPKVAPHASLFSSNGCLLRADLFSERAGAIVASADLCAALATFATSTAHQTAQQLDTFCQHPLAMINAYLAIGAWLGLAIVKLRWKVVIVASWSAVRVHMWSLAHQRTRDPRAATAILLHMLLPFLSGFLATCEWHGEWLPAESPAQSLGRSPSTHAAYVPLAGVSSSRRARRLFAILSRPPPSPPPAPPGPNAESESEQPGPSAEIEQLNRAEQAMISHQEASLRTTHIDEPDRQVPEWITWLLNKWSIEDSVGKHEAGAQRRRRDMRRKITIARDARAETDGAGTARGRGRDGTETRYARQTGDRVRDQRDPVTTAEGCDCVGDCHCD